LRVVSHIDETTTAMKKGPKRFIIGAKLEDVICTSLYEYGNTIRSEAKVKQLQDTVMRGDLPSHDSLYAVL
jgi:hypothetical protein